MDASVGMTFWAGLIVGVLWGVLLMVAGRWVIAAMKRASQRRRQRPDLNPGPGPRNW